MATLDFKKDQASLPTDCPTQSFWHTQPSAVLFGRRSELPATADVVIVGSGITGTFAAWHLKSDSKYANRKVVMLEAREACWGATGRNGGHCQPIIYTPEAHIAKFELETFKLVAQMIERNKISCDWTRTEAVHAFMDQDSVDQIKKKIEKLKEDPDLAPLARLVTDADELHSLGLPAAKVAVVQKYAAAFWPYKLVAFMLEKLVQDFGDGSFSLQTRTPVLGIRQTEESTEFQDTARSSHPVDGLNKECSDTKGAHSWILDTARGKITAKKVLLCCNAYVSYLLPKFTGLIVPVRGQMAALSPPSTLGRQIGHSYVFAGHGKSLLHRFDYLIQRGQNGGVPDGEFLLGGGRGHDAKKGVGISDDGVIDENVAQYLRGRLGKDLEIGTKEPLKAEYEWTGIMGYSRDGYPWVGQVPRSLGGGCGLWVCGAYTGHGMPVGPRCGQGVIDMMVGVRDGRRPVEIPQEFIITDERVERAISMDTVRIADEKGRFH